MYPIWEGIGIHSALYVALIASFHVLASHLTVGATWFNLYLEWRAYRTGNKTLYEYLKRSALGLLVFAYVFGALAGVGIWQTTTAANPRGISALIHNFVLYWGSEWYMFLIDVIGITAYYYTFNHISPKAHLRLAQILALGATGTMSIIVGILSFKVSPGRWLETGHSLHGFFNPTFWPQFAMRLFFMMTITAAWGLLIASGMPKALSERLDIMRLASSLGMAGMAGGVFIFLAWYYPNLPEHAKVILESRAIPEPTFPIIYIGLIATFLALLFAWTMPDYFRPPLAILGMVVLFLAIFGAERTREVLRKPDIIAGYMSSNQLIVADVPALRIKKEAEKYNLSEKGMTGTLPFLPVEKPKARIGAMALPINYYDAEIAQGRLLAVQQCGSCHSVSPQTMAHIGAINLSLRPLARILYERGRTTAEAIEQHIQAIGAFPYMHPFQGTEAERKALAKYLEALVQSSYRTAPKLTAQK